VVGLSHPSAEEGRPPLAAHLLFLLVTGALALRHLHIFYTASIMPHLHLLDLQFQHFDQVGWWVLGEELGRTGYSLGGPLYTWLSLPARLADNPVVGTHLAYLLLEFLCIGIWFYWPTGAALPRRERWIGALALALFWEPKFELAQNDTMMALLLIPLFITLVWSLSPGRWRRAVLPGVLAGMAICVHQSAVILLPLLVICALLPDRCGWQRVMAGAVGLLAAVLLLAAPTWATLGALGEAKPDAGQLDFPWEAVITFAAHLAGSPLALVGLVLAAAVWVRRGAAPTGHRAALVWLVGSCLLFSVLWALRQDVGNDAEFFVEFRNERFAPLNPGRAALAALALVWLQRWLGPRVSQLTGRLPRALSHEVALPLVAALISLGALLPTVLLARADFEQEDRRVARTPCSPELFTDKVRISRHTYRVYDALLAQTRAGVAAPGNPWLPLAQWDLVMVARWGLGGAGPGPETRWRPEVPERVSVMVPRFARGDLAAAPGAKPAGPALIFPRAVAAAQAGDRGELGSDAPMGLGAALEHRGGRRWLLVVVTTHGVKPTLVARAGSGEVTLEARDVCPRATPGAGAGNSWYLFDLKRLPPGARGLRMDTRGGDSPIYDIQALLLGDPAPSRGPGPGGEQP